MITPTQHIFVKCRSTYSNINALLCKASPAFEGQVQMDVIYFDFQKAFDKVSHCILLHKLRKFGLDESLIVWFALYLTNKTFSMKFSGEISLEVYRVTSGVPQGSNLGRLLLIIFINDISEGIDCGIALYADDVKPFQAINNFNDNLILQTNIVRIVDWANTNEMPLNLKKTVQVSFTRKADVSYFRYMIG